MAENIEVKVTDQGYSLAMLGETYMVETRGSVLVSDGVLDGKQKQHLLQKAADMAVDSLAKDIAGDLIKEFRAEFVEEVNIEVRKHLLANKDKYLKDMVRVAKAEATRKLQEVEEYYD